MGQREPARIPSGQAVSQPGFHETRTKVEALCRALGIFLTLPGILSSQGYAAMVMYSDAEPRIAGALFTEIGLAQERQPL